MTLKQEIEKVLRNKWIEWYGEYPIEDFAENMTEMSQAIIDLLISKVPSKKDTANAYSGGKIENIGYNQYRAELLKLYKGE